MKFALFFTSFILYALCGYCQQLQQVAHCPSNEVYDMLLDKKGFIWIAHNLGVSRYDGISFTSFNNPEETSISMTDLVEDHYGRIWCHNFNGQIFYIKDDKMVYLKEYDYKRQTSFPRMVLYGEELVVTTNTGLFICNTSSLKCKYLNANIGSYALCVINNKVLIDDGNNKWYTYQAKQGFKVLPTKNFEFKSKTPPFLKLEPRTFNNSAFVINNSEGYLYQLAIVDDTLATILTKDVKTSINTISIVNNGVWINTTTSSFLMHGKDSVTDYSLTTMLVDREGNKWYGSLTHGLLFSYKSTGWQKVQSNFLWMKDFTRCIKQSRSGFVLCSQFGKVMVTKSLSAEKMHTIFTIPLKCGIPINIQPIYGDTYFIEASKSIIAIDAAKNKISMLDTLASSGDITLSGHMAYLSSSWSLMIKDIRDWNLNTTNSQNNSFDINDSLLLKESFTMQMMKIKAFKTLRRCRAVMFDSCTNSLLTSFTDGLQRIKDNRISYVLYNKQPLYVSSMARFGNKIYAGTFNNGLFVIDGYEVRKVANNSESPQNAIVRIKCCNNHIWVFRSDDIEVLDAATEKFVDIYPFPADVADITDVEEDSSNIFLASHTGLFTIPTSTKEEVVKANPSLLYVLVNNTDTLLQADVTLPANKNNLVFRLAIPVYKDADQLHFKYRLVSGGDTTGSSWYYTQDAQRDIQFNALKPGSYTIELTAIQDDREISNSHLIYNFTISKPWFNTWWFYTAIMLLTVSASIALYQYRLYQHVKMERMRRKISNDLHDDIGSTLSSINVYSQLAKGNYGNESYINTIQTSTVSIINNLDDVVWNINPKNDVLWQLTSRMQLFAETMLQQIGIECIFKAKLAEKDLVVSPNARAHLYLLFKEIVNNIIKHSGSTQCSVYIIQKNKAFRLTVKDNGRGFNVKTTSQHRNGLRIMAERAKELKGNLIITSTPSGGTEIKLKCYLK